MVTETGLEIICCADLLKPLPRSLRKLTPLDKFRISEKSSETKKLRNRLRETEPGPELRV